MADGLTLVQIAEIEQSAAAMNERLVPIWYSMYKALVKEGFTEGQALDLLKTWISKP